MNTYMITRDVNGCITGKVPISVSAILYKNELLKFLDELHKCSMYNKAFRTFKEFQYDWLIKQRNYRKQKAILKHKKLQSKW